MSCVVLAGTVVSVCSFDIISYICTNGLAGYGFEKSREDKARQGKQEERRPEKTRKTKNGKGFAVFFAVEQGVRNKRLW